MASRLHERQEALAHIKCSGARHDRACDKPNHCAHEIRRPKAYARMRNNRVKKGRQMAKAQQVPYASATSGAAARDEITRILRRFGCSNVGFMDKFEEKSLLLAFEHKGRQIQLEASAKGWAALYLQANPHNHRKRTSRQVYEAQALEQGYIAIQSILRDWVKGQVTAVECGIMSFGAVFMPHMLMNDGRRVIDAIEERGLLPPPTE